MSEFFSMLLPPAILILLILAPRRGGRPRWSGSRQLAVFVAAWAVLAITISMVWNRYGLALVWKATNAD